MCVLKVNVHHHCSYSKDNDGECKGYKLGTPLLGESKTLHFKVARTARPTDGTVLWSLWIHYWRMVLIRRALSNEVLCTESTGL